MSSPLIPQIQTPYAFTLPSVPVSRPSLKTMIPTVPAGFVTCRSYATRSKLMRQMPPALGTFRPASPHYPSFQDTNSKKRNVSGFPPFYHHAKHVFNMFDSSIVPFFTPSRFLAIRDNKPHRLKPSKPLTSYFIRKKVHGHFIISVLDY